MPIPDYQQYMLPLLEAIADGGEHRFRDVADAVASRFDLTDEERNQKLPSGQQTVVRNRVGWAKTYLKQAGLVDYPRRGVVRITPLGQKTLEERPETIDYDFLRRFDSFNEFVKRRKTNETAEPVAQSTATPEELLEQAYSSVRSALAEDLLDRVKSCSPDFFEQLVVDLLVAMGYGGARKDAGKKLGRTGDGGIDGIIQEDKLGLDMVCLQAKRWEGTVDRPEIQAFAGSMEPLRARKGVFITTGQFSKEAHDYVLRAERRIVLIDGDQLAQLMIDYDVGVSVARTFPIKRIDLDYFDEFDG